MQPRILASYLRLRAEVDRAAQLLAARHREVLRCAPGCADCCRLTSVLPLEAGVLASALAGLDPGLRARVRENVAGDLCPLLVDGRCAVYRERPIICRTHGLPIGYADAESSTLSVSACPVNFPDEVQLAVSDLLLMDDYNHRLCELSRAVGPLVRVPLADILR